MVANVLMRPLDWLFAFDLHWNENLWEILERLVIKQKKIKGNFSHWKMQQVAYIGLPHKEIRSQLIMECRI